MATLICVKCKSEIASGFHSCPKCADPLPGSDDAGDVQVASGMSLWLVCPQCGEQNVYACKLVQDHEVLKCPVCNCDFEFQMVRIRAKRSRGSKNNGTRSFSVRVYLSTGAEAFIEFVNASYEDFELRAKDLATFSYLNGELRVVQNITIGRYMVISRPGCYVATMVYGSRSLEVQVLRRFRDDVLLRYPGSVILVKMYYWAGPWLVRRLAPFSILHHAVRICLDPLVWVLRNHQVGNGKPEPSGRSRDAPVAVLGKVESAGLPLRSELNLGTTASRRAQ